MSLHSLPLFMRLRGRPVMLLGEGEAADAKRRLLERAGARIVGEADEAPLAIVAIEARAGAEAAAERLRARGILLNVVDRPDLCDFTMPAVIERDPVLVAIATGGASAGLAAALRQRLERVLPAGLGAVAAALGAARDRMKTRFPDPGERRRALARALDEGGALDLLATRDAAAVDAWLVQDAVAEPDRLVTIRLRSGDADDLTLGEARLIGSADRIYHRPGVPAAILERGRADAPRLCSEPPEPPGSGLSVALIPA